MNAATEHIFGSLRFVSIQIVTGWLSFMFLKDLNVIVKLTGVFPEKARQVFVGDALTCRTT